MRCARAGARQAGPWLAEHEAKALLRDAGVAVVEGCAVGGVEQALEVAAALGGAVALKVSSAALQHKAEAGALELGLRTPAEVGPPTAGWPARRRATAGRCSSSGWPSRGSS